MKDNENMLRLYIKEDYSDEIVPMTKLTRGLLHVYHIPKPSDKIEFTCIDTYQTGLSIEELKMCLDWRDHYFDLHHNSCESVFDVEYTEEEDYERDQCAEKVRTQLRFIEDVLGEPQGRFTI